MARGPERDLDLNHALSLIHAHPRDSRSIHPHKDARLTCARSRRVLCRSIMTVPATNMCLRWTTIFMSLVAAGYEFVVSVDHDMRGHDGLHVDQ